MYNTNPKIVDAIAHLMRQVEVTTKGVRDIRQGVARYLAQSPSPPSKSITAYQLFDEFAVVLEAMYNDLEVATEFLPNDLMESQTVECAERKV
jgi:hypothetical protein